MIKLSQEFCWTIKEYYPLGISLILLEFVAEELKTLLPPFLESGYLGVIQIVVSGLLFVGPILYLKKIKSHVNTNLTRNDQIKLRLLVFFAIYGTLFVNVIAVNVFLINLFSIAYGINGSDGSFVLPLRDLVIGFVVYPIVGAYSFWNIRKHFLTMQLEECRCSRLICWAHRNWIWISVFALMFLNLILISCNSPLPHHNLCEIVKIT